MHILYTVSAPDSFAWLWQSPRSLRPCYGSVLYSWQSPENSSYSV